MFSEACLVPLGDGKPLTSEKYWKFSSQLFTIVLVGTSETANAPTNTTLKSFHCLILLLVNKLFRLKRLN